MHHPWFLSSPNIIGYHRVGKKKTSSSAYILSHDGSLISWRGRQACGYLLMTFLFTKVVRIYNLMVLKCVLQCDTQIIRSLWRRDGKRCNSFSRFVFSDDCVLSILSFHHFAFCIGLFSVVLPLPVSGTSDRWSKLPIVSLWENVTRSKVSIFQLDDKKATLNHMVCW